MTSISLTETHSLKWYSNHGSFLSQNRLYLSIRLESSIFSQSMLINTYDLISMIKCQKHGDKALIKSFLGSQFYE